MYKITCATCKKEYERKTPIKTVSYKCRACKVKTRQEKDIGKLYGKWTIIGLGKVNKTFLCKCECGTIKTVRSDGLKNGTSTGCAHCANKSIKHGESSTRLYTIWGGMINRCNFKPGYKNIEVCDEWKNYKTFRDWALNNGYTQKLTIDRKDNYDGYNPKNCRWVTVQAQANNKKLLSAANTSGYRGVSWHKRRNKWCANIRDSKGKQKGLGAFKTAKEAALTYDKYVIKEALIEKPLNILKR